MSRTQRIFVLIVVATATVLLSRSPIVSVTCLPVTSKPIENTPENIAWEAWLMLPPSTKERTRKITPKSIFILNGSQDGLSNGNGHSNSNLFGSGVPQPAQQHIQCPPNHRVDNFKCIPTLSIDRDEIMIKEFAQLLGNNNNNNNNNRKPSNGNYQSPTDSSNNQPNYNYEFEEYDYGDYNNAGSMIDEDIQFSPSSNNDNNNNKPDADNNEQPLKFNLALDKFPLTLATTTTTVDKTISNKPNIDGTTSSDSDTTLSSEESSQSDLIEMSGMQSFRGQTTSSTTINLSTTSSTTVETTTQQNGKRSTNTTNKDTTFLPTSTQPTKTSIITNDHSQTTRDYLPSSITTTRNPIKQINDLELSNSDRISNIYTTTVANDDSTTIRQPLLIDTEIDTETETETENIRIQQNQTNGINITTDSEEDLLLSTSQKTTIIPTTEDGVENNEEFDLLTEMPEIDKRFEGNLAEESLMLDKYFETINNNTTTEAPDQTTTDFIEMSTNTLDESTDPSIISTMQPFDVTQEIDLTGNIESMSQHLNTSQNQSQKVELNEDVEPFIDTIESNNRFVYHHLPTSTTSQTQTQTQSQPPSTTKTVANNDIEEQLRIINMIVEEKKRKNQQTKIRFPDNDNTHTNSPNIPDQRAGLRADQFRFPETISSLSSIIPVTQSSAQPFSFPSNRFDPDKFLFHRRYFQPQIPVSTTSIPIATTTDKPQKPFWWLPHGWEVDQNGEKPLLIRFWSRTPNESSSDNSANRANSNYNNNEDTTINDYQFRSTGVTSLLTDPTIPTDYVTTTTSGYRENSRRPTDNLYREISAQEVYKVLGAARQWRHNSKR